MHLQHRQFHELGGGGAVTHETHELSQGLLYAEKACLLSAVNTCHVLVVERKIVLLLFFFFRPLGLSAAQQRQSLLWLAFYCSPYMYDTIPLRVRSVPPPDVVPGFAKELGAVAVVTDMCPLRDPTRRASEVAEELSKAGDGVPLFQVKRQ